MASEKRSLIVHENSRQSGDRFDEFVTALTVGLIAYQGQHTTITVFGVNEETGQLFGLGLPLVTALAGLARMESKVLLLQLNAKVLDARERAGAMMSAYQGATPIVHNSASGDLYERAKLPQHIEAAKKAADAYQAQYDKLEDRPYIAYKIRNALFLAGTAALAVAKLLPALTARRRRLAHSTVLPCNSGSPCRMRNHLAQELRRVHRRRQEH